MKKMEFTFGVSLPDCADKITHFFPALPDYAEENFFLRDAFHSDMYPVNPQPEMLYPCYANGYLHGNVPSSFLDIMPEYRRTASLAAIDWLKKLLPAETVPRHFDGQLLTAEVDGKEYTFCYPCMDITYTQRDLAGNPHVVNAIVIPVPDVSDNDEDWEGTIVPSHILPMVKMTLWCCCESARQHQRIRLPEEAFVVRICGNTPGDILIRSVSHDTASEAEFVRRICRGYSKSVCVTEPAKNYVRKEQRNWKEKREAELEDAYYTDDPAFYRLVSEYMDTRQTRKEAEAKSKEMKAEMDAIAIRLAAMTKPDSAKGEVIANGNVYKVTHTKRRAYPPKISAELVRQFYPSIQGDVITTKIIPRGRIEVDLL